MQILLDFYHILKVLSLLFDRISLLSCSRSLSCRYVGIKLLKKIDSRKTPIMIIGFLVIFYHKEGCLNLLAIISLILRTEGKHISNILFCSPVLILYVYQCVIITIYCSYFFCERNIVNAFIFALRFEMTNLRLDCIVLKKCKKCGTLS